MFQHARPLVYEHDTAPDPDMPTGNPDEWSEDYPGPIRAVILWILCEVIPSIWKGRPG